MPKFEAYKLVKLRCVSVQASLADFLQVCDDDGMWDPWSQVGDIEYYETDQRPNGEGLGSRLLSPEQVDEAQRQLELEAEAKYGDPEDREAEEDLDSDSYDVEREIP